MEPIRIVWGTAAAPTKMASYDAALAAGNVHNYNLVSVSSVIPAGVTVEAVGEAPDLGPAGGRLTVVEACATVPPGASDDAVAGLGWARDPNGPGLFYEASGTDRTDVREALESGLTAGRALREWSFDEPVYRVVDAPPDPESYTTAVVLAVYGDSDPIV